MRLWPDVAPGARPRARKRMFSGLDRGCGRGAGHYADAGEVAALMALTMTATEDCDMVMTGHSLGRNKLEHLLATGVQPPLDPWSHKT